MIGGHHSAGCASPKYSDKHHEAIEPHVVALKNGEAKHHPFDLRRLSRIWRPLQDGRELMTYVEQFPASSLNPSGKTTNSSEFSMGNAVVLKRHYSDLLPLDPSDDMRGDLIRYRPESLDSLVEQTKFTRKEIQLMYRGFKQGCPRGVVSMEQFREIYLQFFPHDSSSYSTFVFNTFDIDGNGTISFREFAVGLSVLAKGTIEEKIKWIFKLYDLDDRGFFTKDELQAVLTSIYGLMGKIDEYQREKIEDHVDEIFYKMDENHDGLITESEFIKYCLENQGVVQSIALFGTIF